MPTMSFSGKKAAVDETATAAAEPVNPAPEQEAPKANTGKEVAVRADTSPVVFGGNSGFTGNWNARDIKLPRLNLVHKTSADELINKFGIGSICFAKEVKLSDGKTNFPIIAMRAAKDYVQKLPFGDPEPPAVFDTPEEVENNGGTLEYKEAKGNNYFQPRAHIQVALFAPEGLSEDGLALFPYEYDGKPLAQGILTVSSSAFTSVGKDLATFCTQNKVMRQGITHGILNLTVEGRKNAKNSWIIPVIKYAGPTAPALVQLLDSLL